MLAKTEQNLVKSTYDFIENWIENERLQGKSEATLESYRRGLARFTKYLAENGITNPTPTDISEFRVYLLATYSAQSVNLSLSAVRSFYRYLVAVGAMPYSIASDVKGAKRAKANQHKRSELSAGEVLDVLATCDDTPEGIRDRAIITLMAYCGLRAIEIQRANLDNLKINGRMVLWVQGKGRTEADELVVIPRGQEIVIRRWLAERKKLSTAEPALFVSLSKRNQGERLSTRAIRNLVKEHYHAAGVDDDTKTTHSLRHSAITSAIRHGATPMQVQAMARHASFDTTLNYIHEVNRLDSPAEDLIEY
jgi:integrase/recombinase XerC